MTDADDWNSKIIEEFRATGGTVDGPFTGWPLLLLHSTGARSGQERVNPLMYRAIGSDFAVFAAKGGAPSNPDWFHNLVANPRAKVEVGTDILDVTARVAEPDERDRVWNRQKAEYPSLGEYEAATERRIPVVILSPVS